MRTEIEQPRSATRDGSTMSEEILAKPDALKLGQDRLGQDVTGLRQDVEKDVAGDPERAVKDLGRIDAAARKMARLLDELLELSRVGYLLESAVGAGETVDGTD